MHGSQITGKIHSKSDTDIAVLTKNKTDKLRLLELYGDLSKEFKTDRIDIVNATHANPLLAFSIAKKSKLLAGEIADYDKFKLSAFHKYSDYLPYLKKEAEFVKERLNTYVTN